MPQVMPHAIPQTHAAFYPHRGEGKRRNEFAEWHVAWRAEWHNYAKYDLRGK